MTERMFKAEGLVLRTRPLGEADRLVTLLTLEKGKFEAVARGARKVKSRLAAGIDLFTYGRYTFHRGRTWPVVTGQDPVEYFPRLREDPDLYYYGIYLAELTDRLLGGEEPCPDIFLLLLAGWRMLGDDELDHTLLCRAFELQLARFAGYNPALDSCIECGKKKASAFSPRQGGIICSACRANDVIKLDSGTVALARRLLEVPLPRIKLLRPTTGQKRELDLMISTFLAYHLDLGELKSRRLLKK